MVEDWDAAEALWKSSFANKLTGVRPNAGLQAWLNGEGDNNKVDPGKLQKMIDDATDTERCLEDHPLFMTEPSWNPQDKREKSIEVAMESWGTPAFYLGRSGVMGAFGAGKPTALVIDFGASQLSVTPVHDGMILKKGIQKSNLGGNYLSSQVRSMLTANEPPITITPHYMVSFKQPVDAGQPANAIMKEFPSSLRPPQDSFRKYQEEKVVLEFKESSLLTWANPNMPYRGQGEAVARDQAQYVHPFEFPDGYNQAFSFERYKIMESLFDSQCYIQAPSGSSDATLYPAPETQHTLPAMIKAAVNSCDVDIRGTLTSNIVVIGAGSMIKGLNERISQEVHKLYPGGKVRISASGISAEKRFGSWIGGSIVASLGTFHQMWISKKEYDEHGASIVEKRCK